MTTGRQRAGFPARLGPSREDDGPARRPSSAGTESTGRGGADGLGGGDFWSGTSGCVQPASTGDFVEGAGMAATFWPRQPATWWRWRGGAGAARCPAKDHGGSVGGPTTAGKGHARGIPVGWEKRPPFSRLGLRLRLRKSADGGVWAPNLFRKVRDGRRRKDCVFDGADWGSRGSFQSSGSARAFATDSMDLIRAGEINTPPWIHGTDRLRSSREPAWRASLRTKDRRDTGCLQYAYFNRLLNQDPLVLIKFK